MVTKTIASAVVGGSHPGGAMVLMPALGAGR